MPIDDLCYLSKRGPNGEKVKSKRHGRGERWRCRYHDANGLPRERLGWPAEGTFHSLRHYYATALISAGADPTDVQRALRHSSLWITLETYVHWWPKNQRRRNVVSAALREATEERKRSRHAQDQS